MEKINSASLWHITPVDIGVDFFNPTISTLAIGYEEYGIISPFNKGKVPSYFSHADSVVLNQLRKFNADFVELFKKSKLFSSHKFIYVEEYQEIKNCFCCFKIDDNLYLHFLTNGTMVFFEIGNPVPIEEEEHFSYDLYKERKIYEDDYCSNKEVTPRKSLIYDLIDLVWEVAGKKRRYTATKDFCIQGIPYTLCMEMVDIKGFNVSHISEQLIKNIHCLNETTPFSNILNEEEKPTINHCIDQIDTSSFNYIAASDSMLFTDSWAGVVLVGDIEHNINTALAWVLKFEVYLQSQWCFFNFLLEDSIRVDLSHLQLREKIDIAKYEKVSLENDISSTMEQTRKHIRSSLINSSEINVIYGKMIGVLENRYTMKSMQNEKRKSRYSVFTDFMLLLIALFQIYTVIEAFAYEGFNTKDLIPIGVVLALSIIGMIFIIKSKKD